MNNCDRVRVAQELLSSDMKTNMDYIGSLPNNVITQVKLSFRPLIKHFPALKVDCYECFDQM